MNKNTENQNNGRPGEFNGLRLGKRNLIADSRDIQSKSPIVNSHVVQRKSAIVSSPVIQRKSAIMISPGILRKSPLVNSPVIQRKSTILKSPVVQRRSKIHSKTVNSSLEINRTTNKNQVPTEIDNQPLIIPQIRTDSSDNKDTKNNSSIRIPRSHKKVLACSPLKSTSNREFNTLKIRKIKDSHMLLFSPLGGDKSTGINSSKLSPLVSMTQKSIERKKGIFIMKKSS